MADTGWERAQRELRSKEDIRWVGYPIAGRYASQKGIGLFLFGIPWTAFITFWEFKAIESGNNIMILWGLPFIIVGIYLLSTPLLQYWKALRTVYVITNQRLLILNGLFQPTVESYVPPFDIERKEGSDGVGTIIFAHKERSGSKGRTYTEKYGFFAVPNVREVEEMIMQFQIERGLNRDKL